MLYHMLCQF